MASETVRSGSSHPLSRGGTPREGSQARPGRAPGTRLTVAVFCGAADGSDRYLQAAAAIGRTLAEHDVHVLYGGGRLGLMGTVANAALAAGGKVTGIIPDFLQALGVAHPGLTDLRIVPDMATRKEQLVAGAHAVVALPGGFGTLDELAHVWSGSALGLCPPLPVGLLNTDGFYSPLTVFVRNAVASGFLAHHGHLPLEDLLLTDDTPERLVETVLSHVQATNGLHHPAA
ncbi:TIGR00730 family Rossman fold protein (plasmid) [Actinacidiphila glaucinigra]|uniref:LOG family protein n=1 Tax=Actinacidiphila glaucinigra TaxID=235986 RepID=UPI002DDA2ACF|nr:TIGR00730 family Rossman fold protein [Actinacidiphila glaucinigra]WSD65737.1 TIGR00730 family Rossman fold protein [Actinacidiphila glaucinigra]WSD65975.1 TIGR00730 family Rossman fold protein [Actinacidiphila glaucinigra]